MSSLRRELTSKFETLDRVPVERLVAPAFSAIAESPRFQQFMKGHIAMRESHVIADAAPAVAELIENDAVFTGVLELTKEGVQARGQLEQVFARLFLSSFITRQCEEANQIDGQVLLEHGLTDLEYALWSHWYVNNAFAILKVDPEKQPKFKSYYFLYADCSELRAEYITASLLFRLYEKRDWHTLSVFAECATAWKYFLSKAHYKQLKSNNPAHLEMLCQRGPCNRPPMDLAPVKLIRGLHCPNHEDKTIFLGWADARNSQQVSRYATCKIWIPTRWDAI